MKLRMLFVLVIFALTLPAFAVPNCPAPYVVIGNNCAFNTTLGWVVGGLGTQTVLTFYVPPNVTGPITYHITGMSSSLGTAYSGYLGFKGKQPGDPGTVQLTLSDIVAGAANDIGSLPAGSDLQFIVAQVCWDPTCTASAPGNAVGNMLSFQVVIESPNSNDLNITPNPTSTIQFLNNDGTVNLEGIENAQRSNSVNTIFPNMNMGATAATRYVGTSSTFVTLPFDVLSVSNLNNPNPITGTVTIQTIGGDDITSTPLPAVPPGGAAGYLLVGRNPGDPLALFPSSLTLPAGADGNFHGQLVVTLNGQSVNGFAIVRAQEYNGNSILFMPAIHSPIP